MHLLPRYYLLTHPYIYCQLLILTVNRWSCLMSVVLQFRTIRNSTVAINDQWLLLKPELLWLLIHTYIHTHLHTHIHTYIHTYIHTLCCCTFKWIKVTALFLFNITSIWPNFISRRLSASPATQTTAVMARRYCKSSNKCPSCLSHASRETLKN